MSEKLPWDTANVDALEALNDGNLRPILALLRDNDGPIHPEIRALLADMLDPKIDTEWRLIVKKKAGRPAVDRISIGLAVLNLVEEGWPIGAAVHEIVTTRGVGKSTVQESYSAVKTALERIRG